MATSVVIDGVGPRWPELGHLQHEGGVVGGPHPQRRVQAGGHPARAATRRQASIAEAERVGSARPTLKTAQAASPPRSPHCLP